MTGRAHKIESRALCDDLGISGKTLRRYLKKWPHIRPVRAGRNLWFYPVDVTALEEALRSCRSISSPQASDENASADESTETASTSSAANSADGPLKSQRRNETKRLLGAAWRSSSSPGSKVVSLDLARK
jgi:hypothetical protein